MDYILAGFWARVEGYLFPHLQETLPVMTEMHRRLVLILEIVRVEELAAPLNWQWMGAPVSDRTALARAFVAKAAYNMPTTKALVERLHADETLRRLCGWEMRRQIPSLSTFSRAFDEFAQMRLPDKVHEALVKLHLEDDIVWHVNRDATEIEGRERPANKEKKGTQESEPLEMVTGEGTEQESIATKPQDDEVEKPPQAGAEEAKPKRGRPRKGEERPAKPAKPKRGPGRPRKETAEPPEPTRLERQRTQTVEEILAELPKVCDVGMKRNSKGNIEKWIGYKLHVDVGDGGIPLSAITTSASMHDSQAAIPLAKMTALRVTSFYDLMDSAYDAKEIHAHSLELGHVPIIDHNPRWGGKEAYRPMTPDRAERYNNRTTSERFNARLKDDCGGRMIRVRGHAKVHTHLMFGVLVIFAEALLGLLS